MPTDEPGSADEPATADEPTSIRETVTDVYVLLVAAFAGVAGVAGSYAAAGFTTAWVVTPLDTFLAFNMPDFAIRFAITVLGDLGQKLSLITAIGIGVGIFATAALVAITAGRRVDVSGAGILFSVWLALPVPFLLTGAVVPAAAAAAGVGLVVGVSSIAGRPRYRGGVDPERRSVVAGLATAVGVSILGGLLGREPVAGRTVAGAGETLETVDPSEVRARLDEAEQSSLSVDGLDGLVSSSFYEVDINSVDPAVDAENWSMTITGAVENEVELDYRDLLDREPEHQFHTLRCVGEDLNGEKMDNALWTGVSVMEFLEEANPQGEYVQLRAADDFYESFPLDALEDGFLAYGMNGDTLPQGHGYPVRALIPGHWGEINVKWLTEIRVAEEEPSGYWEERGWHGTGPVKTVAKLHHERVGDDQIEVGGHAYAGVRGVSAVEVSTDGGETWTEAEISGTLPDADTQRQWVYRYDNPGERHEVVVRAIEADGTVQPDERTDAYPSGPGGWVSTTIDA